MQLKQKQSGLAAISWLLIIAIAVLFIMLFVRLVPVYLDGFAVYDSLDGLKNDPRFKTATTRSIKKKLLQRLNINSVYSVTADDIYVTKQNGKTIVEVDYEAREKVIGNLYVVAVFQKEVIIQ